MRWWLIDPSGLLHRVLPLVPSLDEAASCVRYFAERGCLLTDGTTGLLLGTNDLAAGPGARGASCSRRATARWAVTPCVDSSGIDRIQRGSQAGL